MSFGPPFERHRASSICFATCVCLFLLRNACLSVCLRLGSTRRSFASQHASDDDDDVDDDADAAAADNDDGDDDDG